MNMKVEQSSHHGAENKKWLSETSKDDNGDNPFWVKNSMCLETPKILDIKSANRFSFVPVLLTIGKNLHGGKTVRVMVHMVKALC